MNNEFCFIDESNFLGLKGSSIVTNPVRQFVSEERVLRTKRGTEHRCVKVCCDRVVVDHSVILEIRAVGYHVSNS